jgi:hypothetical protein
LKHTPALQCHGFHVSSCAALFVTHPAAAAAACPCQVIPSYPTTGSDEQASGIAINSAKADAMDAALQQLNIPGSCITRQSTRCISGAVKAWLGQDTRALAAGSWKQRQQLERDAAEVFLQEGRRCSVTAEVLHQFMVQDGRKSADARHDLAVVFWLAAAALMQRAEQLRLQRRGEQSQVKKQQQAAAKQRTAAKKQQQAGRKRANTGGLSSPAYGVLSTPMLPAAAVAAAGWAAAQASAEPPGAPVKKRRRVKVDPDADCIVLDD